MTPPPSGVPVSRPQETSASSLLANGPHYGIASLAEVMPAVASHLWPGVRRPSDALDVLGLPEARGYVLLLVDGLGWRQLRRELPGLSYFPHLLADAMTLTCAVPATTATSLTTLGTGLVPGRHGIVGYSFREQPGGTRVLNTLAWDGRPDPFAYQPHPTWFERLASQGVRVTSVAPGHFETSGLTLAGLRGSTFDPVSDEADVDLRLDRAVTAARSGQPCFVYLYERALDHVGHSLGTTTVQWRTALAAIDSYVERLRQLLPADVCLLVTGDHGMIDVPSERQILVEDHPQLMAQVDLLAGEGRLRQLYTQRPDGVAAAWRAVLGDRGDVLTREQAIARNWFGPVEDRVRPRLGDVLVAMRSDWAVMTKTLPHELTLVGQHGSLTPEEIEVPLLIDAGEP